MSSIKSNILIFIGLAVVGTVYARFPAVLNLFPGDGKCRFN